MEHALISVSALLLSVAFLLAGVGLQGTLIPVRASLEAFSTFEIGCLGTGYFIGFAAGCVGGPHLIRLGGHARAFLAMSAVASATPLLFALALSSWLWTVMRSMTDCCPAVLYITIETWLNERSTNETRGAIRVSNCQF